MVKAGIKSIAIAQMLSQDQSSEFISLFLEKVFKKLKPPFEANCDAGKAVLKGLCKSFTNCQTIEAYIEACMSSLLIGTAPPACYIRIDRSHFVKNVTNKIKHNDYRKRNMFRCIIGFLIQCENFENARKIIRDLFTLILNEYDGLDDNGQPTPAEAAKKRLLALCRTHDDDESYGNDSANENDDENTDKNLDFNANSSWLDEIISSVDIRKSGTHENLYYSPLDKKMYVRQFSSIVLWSNVMNAKFGSSRDLATSSDVESFFKSLKNGILKYKMLRADDFIQEYINFVDSDIKLNAMSTMEKSTKRKRSESLHERLSTSPGGF